MINLFEYDICNQFDEDIFEKQCLALEKNIPKLIKQDLLTDVDGSKIQSYSVEEDKISVHNDYYLNEVYIKSDIKLEQYFK